MWIRILAISLLATSFGSALVRAEASFEVPALKSPVMDLGGMLSSQAERVLSRGLFQLRGQTGTQVVVLTLPELHGLSIEQASIRVVDQWKLGAEKEDNGVLFLIAKKERRMRIEVGQGLEGAITDAHAKRIIDETVVPLFKQGEIDDGVFLGVVGILKRAHPELSPGDLFQGKRVRKPRRKRSRVSFFTILILFLFFFPWRRRGSFLYLGGGGFGGGGFGGGGFGGGGFGGGGGGFSGGGASGSW